LSEYLLLSQRVIYSSLFHHYFMDGEKKVMAMEKRNCVFSRCHTFLFCIISAASHQYSSKLGI